MATLKQGILGGFSGKVANVIGSSWKGISVMKSRPLSVANPQSAGQVAQRGKFGNSVAFAQLILSTVIKPLWDRFASGMSGFNDFVKTNIDLFANEMPSPVQNLVISKGKMELTAISSALYDHGDKTISLTWVDDSGTGFKLATDIAYGVFLNATTGEVLVSSEVTRENVALSIAEIEGWAQADVKHAYLAFKRADGTIVSNTAYKVVTSQA
jgi:hypothetical protein